ncbi:MAG: sensor domain-containing protein [Actinomycetota bacterium]
MKNKEEEKQEEMSEKKSSFLGRRLREFFYVFTGFPITVAMSAILIAIFSNGISSVIYVLIVAIVLLALLASMEYVAIFEIARVNKMLKSEITPITTPWFSHPFFSWEGARERISSGRSWLVVLYVFSACVAPLLVFLPTVAAIGFFFVWVSSATIFNFAPLYRNLHVNVHDFGGNVSVSVDPHSLHVQVLGTTIDGNPVDSGFKWIFHSTTTVTASILLIAIALLLTPVVARWQKKLVERLLSSQSIVEKYRTSGVRLKKAVAVGTQDRNRIEKDLHDGVQARLTVTGIEIGRAQLLAEQAEQHEISEALAKASLENATAMQEIRNLVRGLRPALLEKNGLEAALKSLVEKHEIDISVEVKGDRFDSDVESAIYLICSEAIMNGVRHSHATSMSIKIAKKEKIISLEIKDDGIGGADESKGTGMRNMHDRVSILGGDLTVFSPEGGPTIIKAVIPCE